MINQEEKKGFQNMVNVEIMTIIHLKKTFRVALVMINQEEKKVALEQERNFLTRMKKNIKVGSILKKEAETQKKSLFRLFFISFFNYVKLYEC